MLGMTLLDQKLNDKIGQRTRGRDVVKTITPQKWAWTGHFAMMPHRSIGNKGPRMETPWSNTRPRCCLPKRWLTTSGGQAEHDWMLKTAGSKPYGLEDFERRQCTKVCQKK
ncbi:unnamed protein product [Arctia plantaginis]|uniref:Uncharacterized protein n=1 Tax=Arctia plantaginis TaxID=874455 RepID=A0A8S0YNZ4_ARCPL|nr:unnamed protein product [Arctia plantaginis]